jgi:hypothetical protein
MKTFESRCQELEAMSKNWKTDSLFFSEVKKLVDELEADVSLYLNTGGDDAEIKQRSKALKSLIEAQETWLLSQRDGYNNAQEIPLVQWVM